MAFLRVILISWLLLLASATSESETGVCGGGWFGPKCQYKCRCTDNKCDDNGICKDGSKCSTGWFGPACQYADLASGYNVTLDGSSQTNKLTDGKEDTCVDVSSFHSLTVDWPTPYPFTWMRIYLHADKTDKNNGLEIQFRNQGNTDTIVKCDNQKIDVVNDTTVDIHCDLGVAVDQVIVSWNNVLSICSIYIKGECPASYYGEDCLESCSHTCRNQLCESVSGKCHGCVDGKTGDFCIKDESTDSNLWLKIGIGICCALIVILCVVFGIVLWCLRKKICVSRSRDYRQQDYEDVTPRQDLHQYEDLHREDDGYCTPIGGTERNSNVPHYDSIDSIDQ